MAGCCKHCDETLGYIKSSELVYCRIISFSRTSLYHGVSQHICDYQTVHEVSEVLRETRLALKMSDKKRDVSIEALIYRL